MDQLLHFLKVAIKARLDFELGKTQQLEQPKMDIHIPKQEALGQFIREYQIKNQDLLLLVLAWVPYIHPGFIHKIIHEYFPNGGEFPEFGGIKMKNHRGIIPTGETALYILAGNDPKTRKKYLPIFQNSILFQKEVLFLDQTQNGEPFWAGALLMESEYAEWFSTEKVSKPKLSTNFPAQLIETQLDWKDLVLNSKTLIHIQEIEEWLKFEKVLMEDWDMKKRIKPGYRVMFYGPPGTGKTLTACLLGKYTQKDVYRIDLSLLTSKYIGETEKNLSSLFDKAAHKNWILFFDEADAIFGKRTNVRDAHDKYANQEVSYLLQRIENHPGLVILASNFKSNIDTAFTRRFQSIIEFPMPVASERLTLWESNIPPKAGLEKGLDLNTLAKKYELSGANIVNIIQFASLKALSKNKQELESEDLLAGIKKELAKEGKMVN
ncbi:ATP-binding protein [Echinicola jeungdonensis]|uniref:ATP-binding protein n=1 Tax=Echinicola jeungdonensis TaxID=709343 RepID=A0ABV5J6V7_9BACT|nr:ATP-binding protein [Echinicola jeungdonensis]MDN3670807.1 ATP-binding protein [Echinicola jeungdonensis]